MLNEKMYALGAAPNKIRELFQFGLDRKAQIGAENVFDYSIGNPSVPAPDEVLRAFEEELERDPVVVHEYTPSPGDAKVRQAISDSISRRFGVHATQGCVYVTSGASSAIAISFSAISCPGEQIIAITPYFPEYKTWANTAGCELVEVPALEPSFQLDIHAIEAAITDKTAAIIINTPNNPTGAVYPEADLMELAATLERKQEELNRSIYLVSDDPYREIVYGAHVAFMPKLYKNTIVCYTYSKSLSLPGERIGYIYVNDMMDNASDVFIAVCGAGRALGYICAPVLLQRVIAKCLDVPSDVASYDRNRELLSGILRDIGYEFVEPEGAFYLWMKALESDAVAFSERAKEFELLLVPSDSFGTSGWVRLSYCIAEETIKNSEGALRALMEAYKDQG